MTTGSSDTRPIGTPVAIANDRELELLRRIVLHDREAFRELYLLYHRRLARFLMRMSLSHENVEEIINDTLWTVWQKSPVFRGDSRVSTWIVGIAYRRALKSLRQSRAARVPLTDEFIDMASDVDIEGGNVTTQWLQCAMAELPTEQRMVMEFAYLMGHSCEEIAEIMHCPVNTVKTRMFHAREKLRASLPRLAGYGGKS
jgi:RNA polymerase sigma-70 factor, ECF subfamily